MSDSDDGLDDILDRASSPICPPPSSSDNNDPSSQGPSSMDDSQDPGPTIPPSDGLLPPVAANPRKRPAEDVTQLANTVARKIKLSADDREAVLRFAKAPSDEQQLLTYGQLLKVSTQLAVVHPPDAVYTVSGILRNKISKHSARAVLDPGVSAYKADLAYKCVQTVLLDHPSWGYTKTVKADGAKSKIVRKVIQKDLVGVRHDVKKTIGDSIWVPSPPKTKRKFEKLKEPQDIISLCEALVSMPSVKDANIPVTFDMLGRVAILRATLIKHPDEVLYWDKVDKWLQKIRTRANNDKAEISKSIAKLLAEDQRNHGSVNVDAIHAATVQGAAAGDDSDDEAAT